MNENDYNIGETILKQRKKKSDMPDIEFSQYTLWNNLNLKLTAKGEPYPNEDNIARILEGLEQYKNLVWYDSFHHKFRTEWDSETIRDWRDVDDVNLLRIIQTDIGMYKATLPSVRHAINSMAHKNARDEPLDWLKSLQPWDGVERIQHFFPDCFGSEESEYTFAVSQNFWIGLIARICDPGCQLDTMVTLEGKQGNYKSTALSIIGGKWFVSSHESVKSNDFYLVLQGHLIVELAELDSLGNAEITRIKSMITNRVDCFRAPYGRLPEKKPRQCVFVGTTNEAVYLKDSTGNRRNWPIKTKEIRIDLIKENREQYFAEAYQKYQAGNAWHEVPATAAEEQEKRRQSDSWEQVIADHLMNQSEVYTHELMEDVLKIKIGDQDKATQMRVSHCLRLAGWERHRERRGSNRMVVVWRPAEEG